MRIPLKPRTVLIWICFFSLHADAQYYMRGAVYDEAGKGIYNVKVFLSSRNGTVYYTDVAGAFLIPVATETDTIILQHDGYETIKRAGFASRFQVFTMKIATAGTTSPRPKLLSMIPRYKHDDGEYYYPEGESYSTLVEHDFTNTDKFPQSGFALNIDRASYSNIRRFINIDAHVPPDAVRIEEMLNYFDLSAGSKNNSDHFTCTSECTGTPWDNKTRLLFINIAAPFLKADTIPPANLVFLIDVSGSMDQPNRLPLLKEGFKMLVNNLRRQDKVAIVVYGGYVGTFLPPTSGAFKDSIRNAIERLEPGGETPGEAAIRTAYRVAESMFSPNANNRIILASDGDFNVGVTADKELEDLVQAHRNSGIYLTCLGVGMGNYKDSKLETLAEKGNGNFAYLDNIQEAEKVLVTEFTKTLYAVADNAYADIDFDPAVVKRYRLIGFDNKKDLFDDTTTELEGGEIGTGHSLVAVYEIEPVQSTPADVLPGPPIADLALHYRLPRGDSDITQTFEIADTFRSFGNADKHVRFAAAVIMFGGLLKQSPLWKNYTWDDVIRVAQSSADMNNYAQAELITLVEKAREIYAPVKRKRKTRDE